MQEKTTKVFISKARLWELLKEREAEVASLKMSKGALETHVRDLQQEITTLKDGQTTLQKSLDQTWAKNGALQERVDRQTEDNIKLLGERNTLMEMRAQLEKAAKEEGIATEATVTALHAAIESIARGITLVSKPY